MKIGTNVLVEVIFRVKFVRNSNITFEAKFKKSIKSVLRKTYVYIELLPHARVHLLTKK
jgi:hypothetical protein